MKSMASSAPTPAEGSVERIVIGWIKTFVEHPENDVDGQQRRQQQQRHRCTVTPGTPALSRETTANT